MVRGRPATPATVRSNASDAGGRHRAHEEYPVRFGRIYLRRRAHAHAAAPPGASISLYLMNLPIQQIHVAWVGRSVGGCDRRL